MLIEGLVAGLKENTAVAGLVGARMYPNTLKEGDKLPALVIQEVVSGFLNTMDGTDPLQRINVQFDAYGKTRASVAHTTKAIRKALQGFTGVLSDGTLVTATLILRDIDMPYEDAPALYRRLLEISFWYLEDFIQSGQGAPFPAINPAPPVDDDSETDGGSF